MTAFWKRKKNPKKHLKKVLKDFNLPSFSAVVMQTLQAMRDPNSSAQSIAKILSVDPGLSVRVLRIANSASFSPTKKIENLTQAVALVGLSQLESLVLSVGIGSALPAESRKGFDCTQFWRAAARRAVLARSLAGLLIPARVSECFTAGFLQDMALPFLAHCRPEAYGPLLEEWHASGLDLAGMERERFEWDHAEVGAWICIEWDLPEAITEAIGHHHHREADPGHILAPVNLVAWMGEGDADRGLERVISDANSVFGLSEDTVRDIIDTGLHDAEELARLMTS